MRPKDSSRGRQTSKKTSFKESKNLKTKFIKKSGAKKQNSPTKQTSEGIRLNKYIANAGICSRREADVYIAAGNAQVNGKLVTEMGFKVQTNDVVKFDGIVISPEAKQYLLLNKPKNYIIKIIPYYKWFHLTYCSPFGATIYIKSGHGKDEHTNEYFDVR